MRDTARGRTDVDLASERLLELLKAAAAAVGAEVVEDDIGAGIAGACTQAGGTVVPARQGMVSARYYGAVATMLSCNMDNWYAWHCILIVLCVILSKLSVVHNCIGAKPSYALAMAAQLPSSEIL